MQQCSNEQNMLFYYHIMVACLQQRKMNDADHQIVCIYKKSKTTKIYKKKNYLTWSSDSFFSNCSTVDSHRGDKHTLLSNVMLKIVFSSFMTNEPSYGLSHF